MDTELEQFKGLNLSQYAAGYGYQLDHRDRAAITRDRAALLREYARLKASAAHPNQQAQTNGRENEI